MLEQFKISGNRDPPDSKVHLAHLGPTWVLSAPVGPHEPHYQGPDTIHNNAMG